jgi:hypothetical protein
MATALISPLPHFHPILNPLLAKLQDPDNLATDNEEPTELEVQLEVEDEPFSGEWRRIAEFLNPYSLDDTGSVLLHRALHGILDTAPPSLTSVGLQPLPGLTARYRLQARDIIGGVATDGFTPTDPAWAWLAGRSYTDQGTSYSVGRAYKFLRTDDSPRYIQLGQRLHVEFISFIACEAAILRVRAQYTDDTEEEFDIEIGAVEEGKGYYFNLPTPVWTKELLRFYISLSGYIGASMESMLFYYKKATRYQQEIFYRNSMGGFQNFIFGGKTEENHTESGEILDQVIFPPEDATIGHSLVFNQRSQDSIVLRSGWITLPERLALKDMLLHNQAYLVVGSQLRKLIITNATHQTRKDGEYLYALEIQARFAYENTALTSL